MKVVSTSNAPAAIGPYSQAIDLGNMVFVSGQIPVDPATGKMADTVEEQAAQSLANLKAILAEAGLSMAFRRSTNFCTSAMLTPPPKLTGPRRGIY